MQKEIRCDGCGLPIYTSYTKKIRIRGGELIFCPTCMDEYFFCKRCGDLCGIPCYECSCSTDK